MGQRAGMYGDAWRFAIGTLTAIPVRPPRSGSRAVAGAAMVLAPFAVIPLGLLVGLIGWAGRELGLAPIGTAVAAVAALALGSRALHLDGLADTADGLTASYGRERALQVMRTGDVGPAGAAAIVLTLGIQVGALTSLLALEWGPVLAGVLVCVSRGAVLVTCLRGIPSARRDGLGVSTAGSVPLLAAVVVWAVLTASMTAVFVAMDADWWRGAVCSLVALVTVGWLVRRAVTRLGGVTGDIYGAAIEIALAALLLSAT